VGPNKVQDSNQHVYSTVLESRAVSLELYWYTTCKSDGRKIFRGIILERKYGSTLAGSKHINQRLTREQSNRDTDSHGDHSSSDINTISVGSDTPCLGKARLQGPNQDRTIGDTARKIDIHTGTKNSTPVTIDVNAVPPIFRE
jgi:hypothetical protein